MSCTKCITNLNWMYQPIDNRSRAMPILDQYWLQANRRLTFLIPPPGVLAVDKSKISDLGGLPVEWASVSWT
jgi:hypothetical protein